MLRFLLTFSDLITTYDTEKVVDAVFSYKDLPRRTFAERLSGDETVEKSRAGQMVLDICGEYDTACFVIYFF